ncbi:hypothetical protein BaRGS_00033301 [Batillaria attramentaria]|uniref:Uncharacterized protein n=1 Tax=Batillaria attramentaria TaxID=370345 RepID=A0ABD0JKM7_9CAEN
MNDPRIDWIRDRVYQALDITEEVVFVDFLNRDDGINRKRLTKFLKDPAASTADEASILFYKVVRVEEEEVEVEIAAKKTKETAEVKKAEHAEEVHSSEEETEEEQGPKTCLPDEYLKTDCIYFLRTPSGEVPTKLPKMTSGADPDEEAGEDGEVDEFTVEHIYPLNFEFGVLNAPCLISMEQILTQGNNAHRFCGSTKSPPRKVAMSLLRWIKRTVTRNRANADDEIIEEQPSIIRNSDGPTPPPVLRAGRDQARRLRQDRHLQQNRK